MTEEISSQKNSVRDFDEENQRTVFVGNLPIQIKMKQVRRLFSEYGRIESVRFRNVAVSDPKLSKKVAFIKSKFHSKRNSLSAYVRFENVEMARRCLKSNGTLVDCHHIIVDMANESPHNWENAIFLGNLALATEEEELWTEFEKCGKIKSIRVVRDNATGVCTGVGYVNFENKDSVELALQLKNIEIRNHIIRIKRCDKSKKKSSKVNDKKKYKKPLDKIRELEESQKIPSSNKIKKTDDKSQVNFVGRKFSDKKKVPKSNKKKATKIKQKKLIEILNKKN